MSPALDLLQVHGVPGSPARGLLTAAGTSIVCALGRSGITMRKREGDGATPAGNFALRRVYYRGDRVARPRTGLPVVALDPALGWSDDPVCPRYNRPVRLPWRHGHERMWREDRLYDYVIVLGHNDAPPLPGLGSAIFLHQARPDLGPTEGCVAIPPAAMRRLLPRLGPRTRLIVSV